MGHIPPTEKLNPVIRVNPCHKKSNVAPSKEAPKSSQNQDSLESIQSKRDINWEKKLENAKYLNKVWIWNQAVSHFYR